MFNIVSFELMCRFALQPIMSTAVAKSLTWCTITCECVVRFDFRHGYWVNRTAIDEAERR